MRKKKKVKPEHIPSSNHNKINAISFSFLFFFCKNGKERFATCFAYQAHTGSLNTASETSVCHSTLKHWRALLVWTNIKHILKRNNSWLNALHACSFWKQQAPPVFICSWALNASPAHTPWVTAWHLWSRSRSESGAGRGFKRTFCKQYGYQNSLWPGKAGQTQRDKYQVRKQKPKCYLMDP